MAVKHAFKKLQEFFAERDTRPGILARELVGRPDADDTKLAELLCNERRALTRMDGSIDGSLLKTAWAAWEMMDLGLDALHGGLGRLLAWLVTHVEGDGPSDPAPLTLPNGMRLEPSDDAAFASRCLALRVLQRARHGNRPALARLMEILATGPQPPTLDLSACVLGALALAPPTHYRHVEGLVKRIGAAQTPAGDWPGTDVFNMLEGLVLAGTRGARAVIGRAADAVARLQHADGSFDDPPHEERALIGLRALHVALED